MKLRTAALSAILAASTSALCAALSPLPGVAVAAPTVPLVAATAPIGGGGPAVDPSTFHVDQTVRVDARLGRASIARGGDGSTLLFAALTGTDAARAAPPLNLAIVIDRSGSMRGERLARAVDAGVGVVERMRDGDVITVVDFDTTADVVVAPTPLSPSNRGFVESAIRGIRIGGDTCISCGIETAASELRVAPVAGDHVTRMLVLSDGQTNHGVTDLPGLRAIAGRMRDRGCAITTIGVDVDFDEKVMAALAIESNGRHYFVANAAGLPAIFAAEFDSLVASVAEDTDLAIDLAPGVEVEQVFDRTFRRESTATGTRIVIPFGVLAAKQEKTALVKLRVPTEHDGREPVAHVTLSYRDLVAREGRRADGDLAVVVKSDGTEQRDLDPLVGDRFERSLTSATLTTANGLVEAGRFSEAEKALRVRATELRETSAGGGGFAPNGRTRRDLDKQLDVVSKAATTFASAAPLAGAPAPTTSPARHMARAQVRQNQQAAVDLAF